MSKIVTGTQIRMARAALRWSGHDLAEKAQVGISTIRRVEEADGIPSARIENIQALYDAFVKTGRIRFEGDNGVFAVLEENAAEQK